MPVRIYALAKDLKLDSKELVDLCTKAGIPGKGSALASLEDDEVVKLKAFMENAQAKKAGTATAAPGSDKARIGAPIRPGADPGGRASAHLRVDVELGLPRDLTVRDRPCEHERGDGRQ